MASLRRNLLILVLIFGLAKVLSWFRNRKRFVDSLKGYPQKEPSFFLGNVKDLLPRGPRYRADLLQWFNDFAIGKSPFVVSYFLGKYMPLGFISILPTEAEFTYELLTQKYQYKLRKGIAYDLSGPLIGKGLLSAEGDHWKMQRKSMEPGFRFSYLRDHATPMMQKVGDNMVERWTNLGDVEVDMLTEMLALTMDVIGLASFGHDFGGVRAKNSVDAPLYHAFKTILNFFSLRTIVPPIFLPIVNALPTKTNQEYQKQMAYLNKVVDSVIEKRLKVESTEEGDLLAQLLKKDENGAPLFTREEISWNVKTFLFAGHDTTASALTWCFYEIARSPEVESKLLLELSENRGENESDNYDNLEKLPYLNAFIKEVLRMHPSAAFTKVALEDITIGQHTIPKGTEIFFLPTVLHWNPKYFPEPMAFRPERWLGEEAAKNNQTAYFPFSSGPRNCIGMKLAQTEIRTTLAKLVPKFRIENVSEPYHDLTMTLMPANARMKISRRSQY